MPGLRFILISKKGDGVMATLQKALLVAAGVLTFMLGCAKPCDCLRYENALGYNYRCADYYDGYCHRTEAIPYNYQRCVACKEDTAAPS